MYGLAGSGCSSACDSPANANDYHRATIADWTEVTGTG